MSLHHQSDIGSQERRWGPFKYQEGYGLVKISRDGGYASNQVEVRMQDNGFVGVESSTGHELYMDRDGDVTVLAKQPGHEVCVNADASVWVNFADGSCVAVMPDGRVQRMTADEATSSVTEPAMTATASHDSVTQSVSDLPAKKSERIQWIADQARAGHEIAKKDLAEQFGVTERSVQRYVEKAREIAPEAFAEPAQDEELQKVS